MHRMYWVCLFCGSVLSCGAQTTEEWLHQRKTRIRYGEAQIAALGVYTKELEEGYKVVTGELGIINNLKRGDFSLHQHYFSSLSAVSSSVSGYEKLKGMADLQKNILEINKSLYRLFASPFLFPSEQIFLKATMNTLLQKCSDDIDHLTRLTLSGTAQMKEEQRMDDINNLYQAMQDRYSFAVNQKESVQLLILSRSREKNNTSAIGSLYGLK